MGTSLKMSYPFLGGVLFLFFAAVGCSGPGEPPPQEDVERLVAAAWEKQPPAAYTFKPPCMSGGGSSASQTGFAITNVRVAEAPRHGRPTIEENSPSVYYWPVTVEISVKCSRSAVPEAPKSLLNLPDSRDSMTVLEGEWIQKTSYVGNLLKNATGTWEVRWPQ